MVCNYQFYRETGQKDSPFLYLHSLVVFQLRVCHLLIKKLIDKGKIFSNFQSGVSGETHRNVSHNENECAQYERLRPKITPENLFGSIFVVQVFPDITSCPKNLEVKYSKIIFLLFSHLQLLFYLQVFHFIRNQENILFLKASQLQKFLKKFLIFQLLIVDS